MNAPECFEIPAKYKRVTTLMVLIGILAFAVGFSQESLRERAWANFLLNNVYFLFLSLSGVFFVALQYAVRSGWATALRRIPEAMMSFLPIGGLLFLGLYFGMHDLYHWTHEALYHVGTPTFDPLLAEKSPYLNIPFFFIRMVLVLGLWVLFAYFLRSNSLKEDETGDYRYYQKNFRISCVFIIVFALSVSMASFDWLMSLEPHWYSTIFGVYGFAGLFVNGVVMITLIIVFLKARGYLAQINENHLHDLGKLIFAFSIFWAYIWVSQFLLIWYSNIPEEVVYYQLRENPHFKGLFYLNVFINWVFPFLVLMTRNAKRNMKTLSVVCIGLIIGHWLDLFLMIMPGTLGEHTSIGFIELGTFLGYLGLFFACVLSGLRKVPLIPKQSAYLEESLSHHQ